MQLTLKELRNSIDGIYSIKTTKVADALGISREHYSRLERGINRLDTLKIEKLAILFKVNEESIIHAWENSQKEVAKYARDNRD